jgi:hypothetical protein
MGELPKPQQGWCDTTGLYVKAFGVRPVGQRGFLRPRQRINGWIGDYKETCSAVPPPVKPSE